jgi:Tol biopolymer transport system component
MVSRLEIYDLASGARRVVLETERLIEAPNWGPDCLAGGAYLLVNAEGRLWRVPLGGPELLSFETGFADHCNNDHGFSPDGQWLALSCHRGRGSELFVVAAGGGVPRLLVPDAPSWFHGWFPDGSRIVYAAARGGRTVDIYSAAADGTDERRLTFGEGHSDGPDVSADGAWVYYNSDRSGHAQIWRVRPDGTGHEQVFEDARANWFPHPSPDGRHVLYLSYPPGTEAHPRDLPVSLWLMDPDGGNRREVVSLTGGQGTMNVPNWRADGGAFAFVSY